MAMTFLTDQDEKRFVKTVNGKKPDANGNVTVEGGSGVSVTAQPGQLIIVKEVDENGNPTAWEAVDRTHWVEQGEMVEILPETTLTVDDDGIAQAAPTGEMVPGETYIINWNGTEYECTTVMGEGYMFGNLGATEAGEPFMGAFGPEGFIEEGSPAIIAFIPIDGSTEFTVSVYKRSETVHKLDNKYLDLDWLPTGKKEFLIPEQSVAATELFDSAMYMGDCSVGEAISFPVGVNTPVYICVNGVEYEAFGVGTLDGDFIQGPGLIGGKFMMSGNGKYWYFLSTEIGIYTVSVYNKVPNKMPESFLPESVGKVKTVNGVEPDENGNVVVDAGGIKTVNGTAPDESGNVDIAVPPMIEVDSLTEIIAPTDLVSSGDDLFDGSTDQYSKFVPGETYRVVFNGTEKDYTAVLNMAGTADENIGLGNDDPISVNIFADGLISVYAPGAGFTEMNLAIYGTGKAMKIDPAYLPNEIPTEAVLYTEQNLTEEQKAQARENIGVASGGNVELDTTLTQSGKAADAKVVGDAINQLSEEMGELSEELEALKVGSAETVKKFVNFDEVIPGKVFTSGFPNGASLPAYTSYKKAVTPGDVYYITSCVVQNDGYGVAHFFYDNTFVAKAGVYGDVTGYVTDYEVTVPPGANIMYVIPGFDKSLGEYDPKIVPTMWKWEKVDSSPDAKKNTASNYVSFNGTVCIVKAKYNDTEDIAFEISPGGGNGLPDIRKIFTTENASQLDDYTGASRTIMSSGTDVIAPHIVKAVNNADGDAPDAEYFTGGNHQTNNQGSGGVATARSEGMTVKCDNVSVDGSAWGNVVTVSWTNYIHGYNTSKADGSGREIMKEEVTLTISGTKISVDVKHYALEDIVRKTYYGLQMVLSAFNSLRYIGGANRTANACDAATTSGNKNCRSISLETTNGDVLEVGIDNVDLGDFSHDGAAHSAFATSYGKSYFAVILDNSFEQNAGEMTTLRGYYHITSK